MSFVEKGHEEACTNWLMIEGEVCLGKLRHGFFPSGLFISWMENTCGSFFLVLVMTVGPFGLFSLSFGWACHAWLA